VHDVVGSDVEVRRPSVGLCAADPVACGFVDRLNVAALPSLCRRLTQLGTGTRENQPAVWPRDTRHKQLLDKR